MVRLGLIASVVLGAGGCITVDCGAPSQIDGDYDILANVVTFTASDESAFARLDSPVNGESSWELTWDSATNSAVEVVIDDQAYTAQAEWDPALCGRFVMTFSGTFVGRDGSTHDFSTAGDFSVFGDQLEGGWTWSELWNDGAGTSGTFDAEGRVSGERRGGAGAGDDSGAGA
jgi:hypothetical protein